METFELNGSKVRDIATFWDEVEHTLCKGATFGRNMDAFSDVLAGGLSEQGIKLNTPVTIIFSNSNKMREVLGDSVFNEITEIIKSHLHTLVLN